LRLPTFWSASPLGAAHCAQYEQPTRSTQSKRCSQKTCRSPQTTCLKVCVCVCANDAMFICHACRHGEEKRTAPVAWKQCSGWATWQSLAPFQSADDIASVRMDLSKHEGIHTNTNVSAFPFLPLSPDPVDRFVAPVRTRRQTRRLHRLAKTAYDQQVKWATAWGGTK